MPPWNLLQKENFTRLEPLLDFLALSAENRARISKHPKFKLNVPRRLAEKMAKNDLTDPIFRQFVPLIEEESIVPGYVEDPVQDATFRKAKKLLHKYKRRALILATGACVMHCRFCFRQNFSYEKETHGFEEELAKVREETTLSEIILSGGDPLSLPNNTLKALLSELDQIPHIRRIRFHTRFPIGIPERIDTEFLSILQNLSKKIFFVIHCNHPKELDPEIVEALQSIHRLGIPLLNQSVLLKGVNDDETTLLSLSETLLEAGILPYYLHLLDPVQGTAHFFVSEQRGHELVAHIRQNLSGFGVPRLVREEAGELSKTFLSHHAT